MTDFARPMLPSLLQRLREPRRFVQVLVGPRQVGKSTLARQAASQIDVPVVQASADAVLLGDAAWIEAQWSNARRVSSDNGVRGALLILDEVQKLPRWSEMVKRLWDEDTATGRELKVLLLGSSPLLVQSGLTESLAGRFELVRATHWSFSEMHAAFEWDLDTFIAHGGYPGSASLVGDVERWSNYILDSLVETSVSRDILLMTRVDKPALLRRLLHLSCEYSGQILSYQKMLGQLHDAGNTTTLAHYLDLLAGAGLVAGLQKFSGSRVRKRGSSPKLCVLNTALLGAWARKDVGALRADPELWGRFVESAIGAHVVNSSAGTDIEVTYWRDGNREVDFVLRRGERVLALEVKSGRRPRFLPGLAHFSREFKGARPLIVGTGGIALAEFLARPVADWLAE